MVGAAVSAELDTLAGLLQADRPGRFLDIGAFDGVTDSLTRHLWLAGWAGVLVEPDPVNFTALLNLYGTDTPSPPPRLVNAAVMPEACPVQFYAQLPAGQLGSACGRHVSAYQSRGVRFRQYTVVGITPGQLLALSGGAAGIDFLSIDAEGVSLELLGAFPLAEMTGLQALCVEHDQDPDRAAIICAAAGLREVWHNEVNLIAIPERKDGTP